MPSALTRGARVRPRAGCPIRRSLAHWLPAPPQGISPRGRVLLRRGAPRHPPCAHRRGHRLRAFPRSDRLAPAPSFPPTTPRAVGSSPPRAPHHPGESRGRDGAPVRAAGLRRSLSRCSLAGDAGGAAGTRTPDFRRARAALSQLSYGPPVGAPGLEPGTSALSGPRSNRLSYAPPRHHVDALPRRRRSKPEKWPRLTGSGPRAWRPRQPSPPSVSGPHKTRGSVPRHGAFAIPRSTIGDPSGSP